CFLDSASPTLDVIVAKASTATGMVAAPEPSVTGGAVTLTAQTVAVAPGGGSPTGTVTFADGGSLIATAAVDPASGKAIAVVPGGGLLTGTHVLAASYGGDADFLTSASPPLAHVVGLPVAPLLTAVQGPNPGEVSLSWSLPAPGT